MISIQAKTIAIIGAGPSGLAAAKYFRAEKAFDKIVIFEQRSTSGGVWNYTPDERDEDLFTIPQMSPRGKNQDPVWKPGRHSGKGVASFLSPVYEKLETNIPRGLMGFQDLDWPEDSQLFPKHETVLQYVQDYGKDVQDLVLYDSQVTNLNPLSDEPDSAWGVQTRNLRSQETHEEVFDAVVVANGHFIVPLIPDVPGIRDWNEQYPGAISHSKYFRRPEEFAGKKVIVVGNSASGLDISSQIATVCQQPLLWSVRSPSQFGPSPDPLKQEYPPISKFIPSTRGVEFENGAIETNIDAVVYATGYFYSLPFLEGLKPELIGNGTHVQNTYKHLFYAPRPTLSFLVLNQRVIPFPVSEAQSALLARVYSGRLSLPSVTSMRKWESDRIAEVGDGKNFHLLLFPKDGHYINELADWAETAEPRDGLDNQGKGKVPPRWGKWEFWCRENFPAIRRAFVGKGEERHSIRTLEELGFVYDGMLAKDKEEEKLI
ncbi:flavin-containing monooxygenase [Amniculicola lignicola CBS 123094]|uniref:Flavin-containing monooxygenase n=1 Tax=Amniculicola lignicola CBS 123094 TaxID=1392246 RepID=A0A6A5W7S0_9PLEO|nr:flavin-containing monooxygenase [Amniculicola lignicola CBS 123094]